MKIHDARKLKDSTKNPFNFKLYVLKNKKYVRNFIIFVILMTVIFFPTWSGAVVGNWIKDFIGTIINIVKGI